MSTTIICFEPKQIRGIRIALHLTQAKFGKKVGKVTPGTVSRWENGAMRPSAAHIRKISELLEPDKGKKPAANCTGARPCSISTCGKRVLWNPSMNRKK